MEYSHSVDAGDIAITPEASQKMSELVEDMGDGDIEAIRVYVSGGGCGGMNYGMTFTDHKTKYDKVLKKDGYIVYIDIVALNFLRGVEIDYTVGDQFPTFVFKNAFKATGGTSTCGACGSAVGAGGGCG